MSQPNIMDTLYDYDGATSVSLAALGVLGTTADDSMRVLYANSDCTFVSDTPRNRAKLEERRRALMFTPLRAADTFEETRANGHIVVRPSEVSPEDVSRALEDKHGPGNFKWKRCTTKWWKDSRGKYVVCGEMNTSWVRPAVDSETGEMVDTRFDWTDLGVEPDNVKKHRHVIAVSGGRFFCKNIREWLPVKYLWIGNNGQPAKRRSKGKVMIDSLFTRIHAVYKVEV